MKNYFSTDQVQAQNPELMADTVSRLSEEEQKLESELNDSANKRWADVPITPKEIGNNKEFVPA